MNAVGAPITVRPIEPVDLPFLRCELERLWLSTTVQSIGRPYQADRLPGFIAWRAGERIGHLTFAPLEGESEVVTLGVKVEDVGAGTALLDAAVRAARDAGHRRVFLTTSNDNLRALTFYQKRGWRLVAVHRGMIDRYRAQGRAIPLTAPNGLPIRDEIELERRLDDAEHP